MPDDGPITGVDFVAMPTADFATASAFYRDVLGLVPREKWGSFPAGEFQAGNLTLAVMEMAAFGQEFRPNGAPVALHVDDVAAVRSQLEAKGVEFRADTMDSGVCHQAFFKDPDGNQLILHHRYAPKNA
jgi:catechol 2,3-dioxygenase-like lactoylglutathione lyase family enzyme